MKPSSPKAERQSEGSTKAKISLQEQQSWDFPDSSVDKTSPFDAESLGSIPDQGVQIPHVLLPKKKKTKKQPKHKKEAML